MQPTFNRIVFFRIIIGYLIGLSFMIGIVVLAAIQLNKINKTVNNLTEHLAIIRELSGDIVNRTQNIRHYAYRFTQTEKYSELTKLNKEIQNLNSTLNQIDSNIISDDKSRIIENIRQSTIRFSSIFRKISTLINSRQFILSTEFKKQELIIENEVSAIRINVNELSKKQVSLAFGNAQKSFHLMQVFHTKYLYEDDEKYFVLFKRHYEYFEREFLFLKQGLKKSPIIVNLDKVMIGVKKYYQTFLKVQKNSVKLRKLNKSLRKVEVEIIDLASLIDQKVKQEYSNNNIQTHDLIAITQFILFFSIIFAVGLSIGLSLLVAKKIMRPLLVQLQEQVDRQTADLAAQNEKNTQMLKTIESQNMDLQTASKLKDEFLANISHELRTPMHGILSFSQFGIEKIDTVNKEKNLYYFTRINTLGERLMSLLNNLLDLSNLEAGKEVYKIESVIIWQLANDAASDLERIWKEKNVILNLVKPLVSTKIFCDKHKIDQVFRNLLSNAFKFTPNDRNVTISLSSGELPCNKKTAGKEVISALTVSIKDEGVGIPDDELTTVFDKFIQSSKTNTGAGGTGLGLAICSEIITAHKGKIWAENNPDGGSTFSFMLPY